MEKSLQAAYLWWVVRECLYCLKTIQRMDQLLDHLTDSEDFFLAAVDFVHHAAAVSRFFWPPSGRDKRSSQRAKERGQVLRELLKVDGDSPLKSRVLRNRFEHFDEWLDNWAESSKNKAMVIDYLGPLEAFDDAIDKGMMDEKDIITHYDLNTHIFTFMGEQFNIAELKSEVLAVSSRSIEKLAELGEELRLSV